MNNIYKSKENCQKCNTRLLIKTITINKWINGTCMNVGTYRQNIEYCPKCDLEPKNRIEFVP